MFLCSCEFNFPRLDTSTICSFPKPWYDSISTSSYHAIPKIYHPTRALQLYEGTYSNPAYGKLFVTYNATTAKLNLHYGIGHWTLYPKKYSDQFYGEGEGILKNIYDLGTIKFKASGSTISGVEMTSFETKSPPAFSKETHIVPSEIVGR